MAAAFFVPDTIRRRFCDQTITVGISPPSALNFFLSNRSAYNFTMSVSAAIYRSVPLVFNLPANGPGNVRSALYSCESTLDWFGGIPKPLPLLELILPFPSCSVHQCAWNLIKLRVWDSVRFHVLIHTPKCLHFDVGLSCQFLLLYAAFSPSEPLNPLISALPLVFVPFSRVSAAVPDMPLC